MSKLIESVYIDGNYVKGATAFGIDVVTPVKWTFSNRIPKSAYASYSLGDIADNPNIQAWIKENKSVIMSLVELKAKLKALSK